MTRQITQKRLSGGMCWEEGGWGQRRESGMVHSWKDQTASFCCIMYLHRVRPSEPQRVVDAANLRQMLFFSALPFLCVELFAFALGADPDPLFNA